MDEPSKPRIPTNVLERAQRVAVSYVDKPPKPPEPPRNIGQRLARQKIVAALRRLHPMD